MVKAVEASKKPKHVWLLAFGILLLLIGFGYKAYIWYQLREDKQRFEETSVLVDKIYSDIVAELGQPEDSKSLYNCTRRSQEFTGYDDPVCHINKIFIYNSSDLDEAASIMNKVQKIVSINPKLTSQSEKNPQFKEKIVGSNKIYAASDSYIYKDLNCFSAFLYNSPSEQTFNQKNGIETTIGCYGRAKSIVYPLAY